MKALGSEPYWEEIAIPCDFYYEIETDWQVLSVRFLLGLDIKFTFC
jgi:hypothetical protein